MRIDFASRPCIILETVELLYAFVNRIPAQELTGDGLYCILGWNLQQIINDYCAGLSSQKPVLQYYFGRVSIQDESEGSTCLARNIVYDTMDFSNKTLEGSRMSLHRSWRISRQKRFRLSTVSGSNTARFCLRFFNSDSSFSCVENDGSLRLYVGVGLPVYEEERQELEPWEYKALRLLGSPARIRMFQTLIHKPMTSREIAQELDMHLGAVSRDVASLFDARLLTIIHEDNKIRYRSNVDAYDTLLKHMTSLKVK